MARSVDDLLRTFHAQGRVEITPSVARAVSLIITSAAIVLVGLGVLVAGDGFPSKIFGLVILAFGGAGTYFSIMRIVGRGRVILLDQQGLTHQGATLPWSEIDGVAIQKVSGQSFVVAQLDDVGYELLRERSHHGTFLHVNGVPGLALANQMNASTDTIATVIETLRQRFSGDVVDAADTL